MTTTFPNRDDFLGLHPGFLITRADVALIADVEPSTVTCWARDKHLQFPETIRGAGHRVHHRLGDVVDWLCSTGRIECDAMADMLTQDQVATRLGVTVGTVKEWRKRRIFPAPDRTIDRRPYWTPDTVDSWDGRPKRGGNTRPPRTFTPPTASPEQRRAVERASA